MEARISQLEARLNIVEARPTALTVEAVAPQLELASDPPVAPEQPGNQWEMLATDRLTFLFLPTQ